VLLYTMRALASNTEITEAAIRRVDIDNLYLCWSSF
jgi:hypothetical protein